MLKHGKLIIFEAGDGSGKETQTKLLTDRLVEAGYPVRKIAYPDYESESSALIKMYLKGDFGSRPGDVSPYVASTFYAVDRYASYKREWEVFYQQGGIVLADRYTTSNMVHQAAKIEEEAEKIKFLNWLTDFEFTLFKLPSPDAVFFLDMPPAYAQQLMRDRANKITGEQQKDIHERDAAYLERSYHTSEWLANRYGWYKIPCVLGEEIRTTQDIHQDIYTIVLGLI